MTYRQALEQAKQQFGDDAIVRAFVDNVEGSLVGYLDALSGDGPQDIDVIETDFTKGGRTARVKVLGNRAADVTYALVFAAKDYEVLK